MSLRLETEWHVSMAHGDFITYTPICSPFLLFLVLILYDAFDFCYDVEYVGPIMFIYSFFLHYFVKISNNTAYNSI